MAVEGVDYAGSRPDPKKLYAAGKRFVVRYGGPGGDWKHLTATEARALSAAGLMLVANAEGTASGMLGGWSAGADWAAKADQHFRGLGMPAGRPIYLSVDFDVTSAQWPAVREAFRGAASVIGLGRVGAYGGRRAVEWARRDGVARWFWQTYAWSGGVWVPGNHLEQYRNGVTVAGTPDIDLDRALVADYGQWTLKEDTVAGFGFRDQQTADNVGYTLTQIPDPGGSGTRVPLHVWAARVDANFDAIATKLGVDLTAVRQKVEQLADVDEAAIAAAVLATLTPQAIAAAIPAELGQQVADELAARLQA